MRMLRKTCLETAGNWSCVLTDSKNMQSGKDSTLQIYMKLKHIMLFIVVAASIVVATITQIPTLTLGTLLLSDLATAVRIDWFHP